MPRLNKHTLGAYLASGCERQLALSLAADAASPVVGPTEADQLGMPPKQDVRPGIQLITKAGRDWEEKKVADLEAAFPTGAIVGNPVVTTNASGQLVVSRYSQQPLATALRAAVAGQFLVECEYIVGATFRGQFGAATGVLATLDFSALRPDIVQVCDAITRPDGDEVLHDGTTAPYDATDRRLRLRIIDIKLTAEPSSGYFAEVVYYSITLAGWLKDNNLDTEYLVTTEAAVWPGSHDAAAVTVAQQQAAANGAAVTMPELLGALEDDLEVAPFVVFSLWLKDFFAETLPRVIVAMPRWRTLPWHVDNTCKNCDWVGQRWFNTDGSPGWHDDQCMPEAEATEHLSRIAFLTKGAAQALRSQNVTDVPALASLQPGDAAFDTHQGLRAGRTVVGARASALQANTAPQATPGAGTSAVMPGWADVMIRVSTYFDVGSGITIAFGIDAFQFPNSQQGTQRRQWRTQVFVVDRKDLGDECDRLLAFLIALDAILSAVRTSSQQATYQVYLWDQAQYEHLTRVIGRHLDRILDPNSGVRDLAWLFPPDELAPNPALATRKSPVTIVREAVKSLVGAPIAHYYSLLELAKTYQPAWQTTPFTINPHPMFHDSLSDQIPSERAHEIWSRLRARPRAGGGTTRDYQQVIDDLRRNIELRHHALRLVTDRLGEDLRGQLRSQAPRIGLGPVADQVGLSSDSHLWYAHAALDAELTKVEEYKNRAMGVEEREARFEAARLTRRLTPQQAAAYLGAPDSRLISGERRVYEIGSLSREAKVKDGDAFRCISPANDPLFLDNSLFANQNLTGMPNLAQWQLRWRFDEVAECSVFRFDRTNGLVVLDLKNPDLVSVLEANGYDLSNDVVLDRVPKTFLLDKVKTALRYIGNPAVAQASTSPLAARATGQASRRGRARTTPLTPAAEVLWTPRVLANSGVARDMTAARAALAACGGLNQSQEQAWQDALTRRLTLIWGPPGTGKSHTLRTIITAACAAAHAAGQVLRILVTGGTYTATDTVVGTTLVDAIGRALPAVTIGVHRVRSVDRQDPPDPGVSDVPLDKRNPSSAAQALLDELQLPTGITIVAAPTQQAHNLTWAANRRSAGRDEPGAELFDLVIIDEASQVDVASATLPLIAASTDASFIVCGDDLQMPPIHAAEPPLGLEAMVGSVYGYLREVGQVMHSPLETNYRSNRAIVEFVRSAGYDNLTAHSPDLRLNLITPFSAAAPAGWPATLPYDDGYAALLDADQPTTAFVYTEGLASQWNEFEAQTTAALVRLLYGRLAVQLDNEILPGATHPIPSSMTPYPIDAFFTKGVGVVTPHRAQQSLVIARLIEAFHGVTGATDDLIRSAVDTVERYQGQQRDVMIATMALGDPDSIADEDEFLFGLRRFNVMASRARAKVVVLATQEVAMHMPTEVEVMRDSGLLKSYLGRFCGQERTMTLPWLKNGVVEMQHGSHRWH
ncbi:DEAD/DEAH box helicase [Cellulosimicrobium sp. JZ28]|uniref:DEAD/DEAH box helicase n=1 Tax=Cellulosimicrobium sp. JZ28 TaxID=1906273 RepID=UPI00188A1D6B|nr:AAA domain-containing protein [Cellulosimicrobium sp. JZ28]